MISVSSDEARRNLRDMLDHVRVNWHTYQIRRYDTPVAMLVNTEWYEKAMDALQSLTDGCPDCGARPGKNHVSICDVPKCPETGLQRMTCRADGHDCPEVVWA